MKNLDSNFNGEKRKMIKYNFLLVALLAFSHTWWCAVEKKHFCFCVFFFLFLSLYEPKKCKRMSCSCFCVLIVYFDTIYHHHVAFYHFDISSFMNCNLCVLSFSCCFWLLGKKLSWIQAREYGRCDLNFEYIFRHETSHKYWNETINAHHK